MRLPVQHRVNQLAVGSVSGKFWNHRERAYTDYGRRVTRGTIGRNIFGTSRA